MGVMRVTLNGHGASCGGGTHGVSVGSSIGFLAGMSSLGLPLLYVYGDFPRGCGVLFRGSSGMLSTCSNVDQIHCGRDGVFVTIWRPTSPTLPGTHLPVSVSRMSASVV